MQMLDRSRVFPEERKIERYRDREIKRGFDIRGRGG